MDRGAGKSNIGGRPALLTALFFALVALLLRAPQFGNPLFDVDEQYYLVVGDRILHGALPYVDVWDRKPIGLFLIFAAIRALGGDGVLAYQLVATLFAAATATVIAAIARRVASPLAAAGGGLAYLVWLNLMGGGAGQSPVFYNLLTAFAALATLRAIGRPGGWRREAMLAMLAMGLAIQVKPTVVLEGCLFGCALLARARQDERRPAALMGEALWLAGVALAPTVAVLLAYGALGHGEAIWFATFVSVFHRTAPSVDPVTRLAGAALVLAPLATTALAGVVAGWTRRAPMWFIAAWIGVALAAFLAIPPYHNHYALPLLVPLAAAAPMTFDRSVVWRVLVAIGGATLLYLSSFPDLARARGGRARLSALETLVAPRLHGGCLYVFEGPPITPLATHACTVTPYLFPNHLNALGEAGAIGVDPAAEVRRILAQRPAVILAADRRTFPDPNPATWPIVERALAADYRRVGGVVVDFQRIDVYERRR